MPKGAALTHTNFTYDLAALDEWGRLVHEPGGKPERFRRGFHTYLGVLPWYHSFGMTVAMLSACGNGARLVCVPDPRAGNPPFTEVLKLVQKHRPTIMPAVPTIFVAFTNHPLLDQFDLTSLMGCFSGGAPLPPEVCRRFEEKTGAVIFEGYGLSETAPVASANPTNTTQRKIGTIGFPMPGTDIKIVDMETGLTGAAARRGRGDRHLRPPGDEGLLEPARGEREGLPRDRRPALFSDRRHRPRRRGRATS